MLRYATVEALDDTSCSAYDSIFFPGGPMLCAGYEAVNTVVALDHLFNQNNGHIICV